MIVKKATTIDVADIEMQQGTLGNVKTSTSQESRYCEVTIAKHVQQFPRTLPQAANETKSDDIVNFESPCTFSHQANNGSQRMPKTPTGGSSKMMQLARGSTQTSSFLLSQELNTSSCTTKVILQNNSYYGDRNATESSSSASTPASSNDPLKRSPTDAEIWSEVRKRSLSQLQPHKKLLLQELKVLNKSLSCTQQGPAKIAERQSLHQIVRRNLEIVKNAIFLLELGKEKVSTPHQPHQSPHGRPSLMEVFKDERKRLTKELKTFEDAFAVKHGRPIGSSTDIEPQVHQYRRLQKLLGATAALSLEHEYKWHEKALHHRF